MRISRLIKIWLDPPLKSSGFTRKSRTWSRRTNGKIDVVDVQTSRWNRVESGAFTINLGIFLPEVFEIYWGKPAPACPKEWECVVRMRIGRLLGGIDGLKRDQWFDLNTESDVSARGEETSRFLTGLALPFFDSLRSTDDVAVWWLEHTDLADRTTIIGRFYEAILLAKTKHIARAKQVLERFLMDEDAELRDRAFGVAFRLGIELETTHEA
jgi:Domain of unknown function (DUF4304)